MLNLILFGPPGAGKGTQADIIIKKFDLIHLSTGELLRSQIEAETELGLEAKVYIEKGFLVADSIVISMIQSKLAENKAALGFIFDGFPRTVAQAKALDELLNENGTPVSGMLCLSVEKEELINRLSNRAKTSGRPDDQDVSIIENRIRIYHEKTEPLRDYYKAQDKYFRIDGKGSVEEISKRLIDTITSL
jgi:adenylate kinase